jgi:hypothetical protein
VVAWASTAAAQSDCEKFVKAVGERNDALKATQDRVEKLRPGRPECGEARKLAADSAALQKHISDSKGLCANLKPDEFTAMRLRFYTAARDFNATLIDDQVGRLCR